MTRRGLRHAAPAGTSGRVNAVPAGTAAAAPGCTTASAHPREHNVDELLVRGHRLDALEIIDDHSGSVRTRSGTRATRRATVARAPERGTRTSTARAASQTRPRSRRGNVDATQQTVRWDRGIAIERELLVVVGERVLRMGVSARDASPHWTSCCARGVGRLSVPDGGPSVATVRHGRGQVRCGWSCSRNARACSLVTCASQLCRASLACAHSHSPHDNARVPNSQGQLSLLLQNREGRLLAAPQRARCRRPHTRALAPSSTAVAPPAATGRVPTRRPLLASAQQAALLADGVPEVAVRQPDGVRRHGGRPPVARPGARDQ